MKQAKDEAEKEMEEYRSRLEEEYQTQVSGVSNTETKPASEISWFVLIFFTFCFRRIKKQMQNV